MRKLLVLSAVAGLALSAAFAAPAAADSTTTTVTVAAEGLTVSVPGTADLGSVAPGATASGQLGPVTVTDERAELNADWTVSVIATDFTTGGGTGHETIPDINVTYWSGDATATTGLGTFTPGQPTAGDAQIINVPRTAFSHTGGDGNNSATWNPTVVIAVPATVVAGLYTGTVTHSVF